MTGPFGHVSTYLMPGALALGGLAIGITVRGIVIPLLAKVAVKTQWEYDDVLIRSIKNPLVVWFALLGVQLAIVRLPFEDDTHELLRTGIEIAFILSLTWAAARFAVLSVHTAASGGTRRGVSLVENVVRVVILAIGLLVVLDVAGVKITGLLAAFGVGGIAVGLALQDTLSSFFAGLRILVSGKIRPGDFIRLESGQEGTVHDITWNQTTVVQPPNNLVIVPNSRLAASVTTNYSLPDNAQNFTVPFQVVKDSDLERVEMVAVQVARETLRVVEEAVSDFEPRVRYDALGESGIGLFVVLRARHVDMRYRIVHEFIKRLVVRFRAEGIELAMPIRSLVTKEPPPRS